MPTNDRINKVKQANLLESVGYGVYGLTDLGRQAKADAEKRAKDHQNRLRLVKDDN